MANLPSVIKAIILDYSETWQLVDWLDEEQIKPGSVVRNPRGGDWLIKKGRKTRWRNASSNPSCWYFLRDHKSIVLNYDDLICNTNPDAVARALANVDKMQYVDRISAQPLAIDWLTAHPAAIRYNLLVMNPAAEALVIARGIKKLVYDDTCMCGCDYWARECTIMIGLCRNTAQWAMNIVEDNIGKLKRGAREALSGNASAMDILRRHPGVIEWPGLNRNHHPQAVALLLTRPHYIRWSLFSANPAGIDHIRANVDKVDMAELSRNPAIFELKRPAGLAELLTSI